MKQIWQKSAYVSSWFRSCSVCRLGVPPVSWLCSDCWAKLKTFYLSPEDMIREQEGLTHFRLFNWNKENDFFIRLFLNSLKKGGPSFIFNKLILDFLNRVVQISSLPVSSVWIPAPSQSVDDFRDHAFCLASAFSHFSGMPLKNPLLRPSLFDKTSLQKQKNRQERKEMQFSLKENSFVKENEKVIFVDDILTTGATARAGYKALKAPKEFRIFTLAFRSEKQNP